MRRLVSAVALALPLFHSACVVVSGFDPVGNVASIRARWTIDHLPVDEVTDGGVVPDGGRPDLSCVGDVCSRAGIAQVRVTFLDELRPIAHSALFFPCADGQFDTRADDGDGPVIGAGTWTVRLDALDSNGQLLAVSGEHTQEIVPVSEDDPETQSQVIELPDTNFLSSSLDTAFRIRGADADEDRCASEEIADVGFHFVGPAPELSSSGFTACSLGVTGVRVLPGEYEVGVRARDATGDTAYETDTQQIEVGCGEAYRLRSEPGPDGGPTFQFENTAPIMIRP